MHDAMNKVRRQPSIRLAAIAVCATCSSPLAFGQSSPIIQLGVPQATVARNDAIPSSPWNDTKSQVGNNASYSNQYVSQPIKQPFPSNSIATYPTSVTPTAYQPQFIEQPVAPKQLNTSPPRERREEITSPPRERRDDVTSPPHERRVLEPTQQQPNVREDELLFDINPPLSHITQPTSQFRTASTQQAIASHDPSWNTLPARGVALPESQQVYAAAPVPTVIQVTTTESPEQAAAREMLEAQMAKANDDQRRREVIAKQVSQRLLRDTQPRQPAPQAIESPRGWTAEGEELVSHLRTCDELLRRGAVHSAREEVLLGLRALARAIDFRGGQLYSEPALDRAMRAFTEERDFHASQSSTAVNDSLVAGHQTPVLREANLKNVSPVIAAQHYRAYARRELIAASQGHIWAADFFYAYGKTLEAESETQTQYQTMFREQAIVCYQAALSVARNHSEAANQLGYSLLKVDRAREAEQALVAAVSSNPSAEAWKNLAEVYRREGDMGKADYAVRQASALEQNHTMMSNGKPLPDVVSMAPEDFVRMSPNLLQGDQFNQPMLAQQQLWNQPAQYAPSMQVGTQTAVANAPAPEAKVGTMEKIKRFFR
jgi:tetratricopeptide (TPR) repeat protein